MEWGGGFLGRAATQGPRETGAGGQMVTKEERPGLLEEAREEPTLRECT